MILLFELILLLSSFSYGATVATVDYDLNRTGSNTSEISLTTSNVSNGKFGKLRTCAVNGDMYGQVLFIPSVTISAVVYDVILAATGNNDVYAFDVKTCTQLWHTNLGTPWSTYSSCCSGNETFYGNPLGVVSSMVVNSSTFKMWCLNAVSTPNWVLSRIDITTGTIESSVNVAGVYNGVTFATVDNIQGCGLGLSPDQSKVYFCFGGWENGAPNYYGWVFAYDTSSLSRVGVFCTSSTSANGAVPWMSRGAPAIDSGGNVYVVTGNGTWDGTVNYGQSLLKFSSTLSLLDWFTPSNWSSINSVDADFSSGRAILIPNTSPQLVVAAGKDFNVYLIDTTCMGHLQGSSGCSLQTFKTNSGGVPAAFTGSFGSLLLNNTLYLPLTTGPLYSFSFSSGTFNTTPNYVTGSSYGGHNGQIAGSSNGGSNEIVWVTTSTLSSFTVKRSGTLRAIRASDGVEIWNSGVGVNTLGTLSKFANPTIANGLVIVPTQDNDIAIFGLLPQTEVRGNAVVRGKVILH